MEDKEIKEQVARYWDIGCKDYDAQDGHGLKGDDEKQAWLKFLQNIVPVDTKDILDVGCGTGFLTLLLAELGYNVKGIDLSEGMQSDAKRKVSEAGLVSRVTFDIADAENTGEEDDKFDVVINRHLLWTLPHPREAVDEWIRVTKPGGCVIIIDGDWNSISREVKAEDHKDKNDDNSYSEELIQNLPLHRGEGKPFDYIDRDGYEITIVSLKDIDNLERKKYVDNDWLSNDNYKREAYVIRKPQYR